MLAISKSDTCFIFVTKTALILVSICITIILISTQPSLAQNQYHEAKIEFDLANYFTKKMSCYVIDDLSNHIQQEKKKAIIIVTDPDANKFDEAIDRIKASISSDTDPKGIVITAYETHLNSGVFEGTVLIDEVQSTQNTIHVVNGDTLWAKYVDTTLPSESKSDSLEVTAFSFIGVSCPPPERVPASGIRIIDKEGNEQETILVDQQVQILADLANPGTRNETFAYIVQIQDKNGFIESLGWLSGVLLPSQAFNPSVSWTPSEAGNYTATVFVWSSIDNPDALSPPISADFIVLPSSTQVSDQSLCNEFSVSGNAIPVELKYQINGGSVEKICKFQNGPSVTAKIDAHSDGQLTIEVPKKLVYSLAGGNCEEGEILVLMDNQEIVPINVKNTTSSNLITIEFKKGEHVLEFAGYEIIPYPSPSMLCGIVRGYDSQYLPPRFQWENGVPLKAIRCNEGLELVMNSQNGKPACVKPQGIDNLIKQGWTRQLSCIMDNLVGSGNDTFSCFCEKGQELVKGGYFIKKDSSLEITRKDKVSNENNQTGIVIEIFNPQLYSQYASVWSTCK